MAVIETERLALRRLTPQDVDRLMSILADPVAMRHYPSTLGRPEVEAWVERQLQSYRLHGIGFLAVEDREGRFLGQCGLLRQEIDGRGELEVAYLFARSAWGHGYATEAARACRDWGFRERGCGRLVSLIRPVNLPSIRVAERNGMHPAGALMKSGMPHVVYAIRRDEWLRMGILPVP